MRDNDDPGLHDAWRNGAIVKIIFLSAMVVWLLVMIAMGKL
jgi:hypothetical protein